MSTRQAQGTTLFTALLVLVGIGVVVQLWLLAASVDAFMRHEPEHSRACRNRICCGVRGERAARAVRFQF